MPAPRYRSSSYRKLKRHTPGGRTTIIYKRHAVSPPRCSVCGKTLSGFKRWTYREIRGLSKTKKTVSRPYGGYLCSSCLKNMLKNAVRSAI